MNYSYYLVLLLIISCIPKDQNKKVKVKDQETIQKKNSQGSSPHNIIPRSINDFELYEKYNQSIEIFGIFAVKNYIYNYSDGEVIERGLNIAIKAFNKQKVSAYIKSDPLWPNIARGLYYSSQFFGEEKTINYRTKVASLGMGRT